MLISTVLQRKNYDVLCRTSLDTINEIISAYNPHMVILDIVIGDENGLDYIPSIKSLFPKLPIIVVSSFANEYLYQVKQMIGGIDAYLTKPLKLADLIFICEKYTSLNTQLFVEFGKVTLNCQEKYMIKGNGKTVILTPLEYKLLNLLIVNRNKIVTREQIETHLYGIHGLKEYSINNLINSLRKHFIDEESISITTVRFIGYKLNY